MIISLLTGTVHLHLVRRNSGLASSIETEGGMVIVRDSSNGIEVRLYFLVNSLMLQFTT